MDACLAPRDGYMYRFYKCMYVCDLIFGHSLTVSIHSSGTFMPNQAAVTYRRVMASKYPSLMCNRQNSGNSGGSAPFVSSIALHIRCRIFSGSVIAPSL